MRLQFHEQLAQLWKQKPLVGRKDLLQPDPQTGSRSLVEQLGGFQFVPLVSKRVFALAELDIVMLRPEEPGHIITQGGDIDNRLKTLFDSLRMPRESREIMAGSCGSMPCPLYCLLQDDHLVTSVSVTTDRWLVPSGTAGDTEVILVIRVTVKPTQVVNDTLGLF